MKGYDNRHAAKQATSKGHHDGHVRPYQCQKCGYWHVGTLPAAVIQGEMTAAEFYDAQAARAEAGRNRRRSPEAQLRRARISAARLLARDGAVLAEMWADCQAGDREGAEWADARNHAATMIRNLQELIKVLAGPGGGEQDGE